MSRCSTRSARISGRTTTITVCCSAGRMAGRRIPTRSRDGPSSWPRRAVCQKSTFTTSATAMPPRDAKIDWKALSQRIGHADVAFTMKQYVPNELEANRRVANTLAELIIGGALASTVISDEEREDQGATTDGDPGEAA